MTPSLHELLTRIIEKRASDLHISAGTPPQIRVDGDLFPLPYQPLTAQGTKDLCYSIMTEEQRQRFEEQWELDFSFGIRGLSRFRVNIFYQRGSVGGSFRAIPYVIPSFSELGLPRIIETFIHKPRGLILVTGPTGSGKSTTLASMIDRINEERSLHIVTIEDPIEYLHSHKKSIVNQRQIGEDTKNFAKALRHVLRQDPDVVLIGEMRDLETVESALNVAETGHLVFATLHTNSAVQTINRIIDIFPPHQQAQIRIQLSFVIEGVVSQLLLPRVGGGRVLATEVMIATPAIRNLIRDEKVHMIYSQMQLGQTRFDMRTMNQSLINLYREGRITIEEVSSKSPEPDEIKNKLKEEPSKHSR